MAETVAAPDGMVREIECRSGRRYTSQDGVFRDVPDRDAREILKVGGFRPSLMGSSRRTSGYVCTECRRRTWFNTCGRCGASCVKESEHGASASR